MIEVDEEAVATGRDVLAKGVRDPPRRARDGVAATLITAAGVGLVGVKSAIRSLGLSLAKGVESTGCPASKKWTLKFQNVYTDGSQTKTATAPCRR